MYSLQTHVPVVKCVGNDSRAKQSYKLCAEWQDSFCASMKLLFYFPVVKDGYPASFQMKTKSKGLFCWPQLYLDRSQRLFRSLYVWLKQQILHFQHSTPLHLLWIKNLHFAIYPFLNRNFNRLHSDSSLTEITVIILLLYG